MKMGALDKRRLERELRGYGMPRCWALLAVARVNAAVARGDLCSMESVGGEAEEGVRVQPT